jgi:YhgE/Pip-like protein
MKHAIQAYMKKPTTMIGIVTAIMFQLLFSIIWMTGYQGVTDNTKNLKIAIVNEDQGMGTKIVESLKGNLPFQTEVVESKEIAGKMLDNREVQMVIHIQGDFSKQLQAPGAKAPLNYSINESNPTLIKSIMQGVATNVTNTVNKEAVVGGAQAILTQLNPNLPAAEAGQMAKGLADKVSSNISYTNKVKDMPNQMMPMMMVLASIVGTMIMGMNFQASHVAIGNQSSKWAKFAARITITVAAVIVVGLIGSSLVVALGAHADKGFLALWGFQSLFLLAFALVAQMFLALFGNAGMLFNIAMLSLQLVSSGAMVPRELLSDFYRGMSDLFPATYAVEGLMNICFGGPVVGGDVGVLLLIAAIALLVALAVTVLRKEAAGHAPVMANA